jgi:hypothetical protein
MRTTGAAVGRCLYPSEMQRLFTVFPAGIPGIALVLLRLSVMASLWLPLMESESASGGLLLVALTTLTLLLLIGLATPLVGTITVILLIPGITALHPHSALNLSAVVHAVTGLSLILIGPGAFSVDARLFGRRVLTPP